MEKIRKYYLHIVLVLMVLFGFEIRFAISNCPMWYDEGHSILAAIKSCPFGINEFLFTKDFQHTPFYFYFLHYWIKFFGTTEVVIRLSSIIFGLACIPMTYVVANKLYNRTVGIISALLVTVSPLMIYYSIEIRMYAMVTLFALISMNYLLDYDEKEDKKSLKKMLLTNILIPYNLIGGIVFNVGQFIAYTVYLKLTQKENTKKFWQYLTYQVYQLILLIPYFVIAIYYSVKRHEFIMFHIPPCEFMHFVGNLQNFFGTKVGAIFWVNIMPWYINFFFFISVIVPIIYFINALIKAFKEKNSKLFMVFLLVIISYSLILLSGIFKVVVIVPRYTIFIVPLILILASVGFSKLKKWHLAVFLLAFSGLSIYNIFYDPAYFDMKYSALIDVNNYYQSRNLTSEDMVYRPFASSVAFVYQTKDTPITPSFESLHEFRKPYNKLVYDDYQIQQMKQGFVDKTLFDIIQSEGHVSQRYYEYIKKTYLDNIKPGRYVVMVIYGPDTQALADRRIYTQRFNTPEKVHDDRILALLFKLFDDTKNIFLEECDFVEQVAINDNVYLLFKKR